MGKTKFSVTMNKKNLKKLTEAQKLAGKMTADKMLAEKIEQQQIPLAEGTLQNVQSDIDVEEIEQGNIAIVHDTPYADRLYFNPQYNFNKEFNVNAQGEWWEDYITGDNKDRPSELYAHYLKKSSGGVIN